MLRHGLNNDADTCSAFRRGQAGIENAASSGNSVTASASSAAVACAQGAVAHLLVPRAVAGDTGDVAFRQLAWRSRLPVRTWNAGPNGMWRPRRVLAERAGRFGPLPRRDVWLPRRLPLRCVSRRGQHRIGGLKCSRGSTPSGSLLRRGQRPCLAGRAVALTAASLALERAEEALHGFCGLAPTARLDVCCCWLSIPRPLGRVRSLYTDIVYILQAIEFETTRLSQLTRLVQLTTTAAL